MQIRYARKFKKQYEKAPKKIKQAFKDRRDRFSENPSNPILNNRQLIGKFKGYRSINITGDWRAIYSVNKSVIIFETLGTHSQLYK